MKIMNKFIRKKILICAPSNAAINEIILRIIQNGGLYDSNGNSRQANLIRIGLLDEENVHSDIIKKVSLEDLAQHKLFQTQKSNAKQDQNITADLRIELQKNLNQHGLPSEERKIIKDQINQFNDLRKNKQEYLDKTRENKKIFKEVYNQFCEKLQNDSEIICSTLSSSGSDKLSRYLDQIELLIFNQCSLMYRTIQKRRYQQVILNNYQLLYSCQFVIKHYIIEAYLKEQLIIILNLISYIFNIKCILKLECFDQNIFNKINQKIMNQQIIEIYQQISLKIECYFQIFLMEKNKKMEHLIQKNKRPQLQFNQLKLNFQHKLLVQYVQINHKQDILKHQLNKNIKMKIILMNQQLVLIQLIHFKVKKNDIILFSCVRSSQKGRIGFLNDSRRMNVALTRTKNILLFLEMLLLYQKSFMEINKIYIKVNFIEILNLKNFHFNQSQMMNGMKKIKHSLQNLYESQLNFLRKLRKINLQYIRFQD